MSCLLDGVWLQHLPDKSVTIVAKHLVKPRTSCTHQSLKCLGNSNVSASTWHLPHCFSHSKMEQKFFSRPCVLNFDWEYINISMTQNRDTAYPFILFFCLNSRLLVSLPWLLSSWESDACLYTDCGGRVIQLPCRPHVRRYGEREEWLFQKK